MRSGCASTVANPSTRSRKRRSAEIERPAVERRLDEQHLRIAAEPEPAKLLDRPVELGEVDLAAGTKLDQIAGDGANLGERRLHLVGRRRVVVADVRRRREQRDPVGGGLLADRERLVEIGRPVVEAGQDVAVEVDQSAANARYSSRAALIPSGT